MSNFDGIVHSPNQLRVYATLSAVRQAESATLEWGLGASKSLPSKQLKVLTDAGCVILERKPQSFDRSCIWAGFTPVGRKAYRSHVAVL